MPFPTDRFERAGATAGQIKALEARFDDMSVGAQESFEAHVASLSDGGVAEEYLTEPEAVEEPEPVEADEPDEKPSAKTLARPGNRDDTADE